MKPSLHPKAILLSAISGVLLTFSQPFFDISFLAWVGLIPSLLHLKRETAREGFLSGMVLGLFYFTGTQYWIYHSLYHYGGFPFVGSILLVLLLCLYESIYTGIFGLLVSHLSKGKTPLIISAPFIWTGLEYLRGMALTGFPWSVLGYSQHGFISLIQISDITGVYGISFLIVLINATIVELLYTFYSLKDKPSSLTFSSSFPMVLIKTAPAIVMITGSLLYGQYNLQNLTDLMETDSLKVSLIQGNIEQDVKWNPLYQEEVMRTYEDLTVSVTQEEPELVVWPETAIPFFLNGNKELFERLVSLPVTTDVPLLTGAMIIRDVGEDFFSVTNSAVLINPDGKIPFEYDKIHLVPFGEYVPLKKLFFFIEKLVSVVGEFLPGDSYDIGEVKSARFPVLICYEVVFPDLVR
ncbi:MAG: apolipoprotein N-acyltransferase, partial [Nitrospirae bacterium]